MLRTIAARRDDGDEIVVLVLVFASLEVFFGITNVECCSSQNIMLLYSSTAPSILLESRHYKPLCDLLLKTLKRKWQGKILLKCFIFVEWKAVTVNGWYA